GHDPARVVGEALVLSREARGGPDDGRRSGSAAEEEIQRHLPRPPRLLEERETVVAFLGGRTGKGGSGGMRSVRGDVAPLESLGAELLETALARARVPHPHRDLPAKKDTNETSAMPSAASPAERQPSRW